MCVPSNFLQFFSDSHEAHNICVQYMQENCGTDFRDFDFKIRWQIFEILHLDLVSAAVEQWT